MMYLPWRIRPPTGSEQAVLFWGIFPVLVGFGAMCQFFGYRAPPEKVQEAAALSRGGYGFISAGVLMCVMRRFFCGFSS
jgi:hypothetical protein